MVALLTAQSVKEKRAELLEQREQLLAKIGDNAPNETQAALLADIKEDDGKLKKRHAELLDYEGTKAELDNLGPEIPPSRVVFAQAKEPDNGQGPYKNFRQQLEDVRTVADERSGDKFEAAMKRLQLVNAVGSDEQSSASDPYGGFLVAPAFLPRVLQRNADMDPTGPGGIAPVTTIPIASASIDIPARVDTTHTTSVTGGFNVSRRAQTVAGTSSRGEFEKLTIKPVSMFGLAYATEEILMHSAVSMAAIIEAGMRDEFQSEIFREKLNGTGAGEMEGILNSPAIIAVTRTTGSTLKGADIVNVRSRAYRYGRSIWLANHNALAALELAHRSGTNSDTFYFRAGSVIPGIGENASVDIPDTLMGRPIIFNEYIPALGSLGDLILWDPTEYLFGVGVASGASGMAESIHVRFENHERTYKFWQMNDGRCWWRAPLQPVLGSTLSPIVTVAA